MKTRDAIFLALTLIVIALLGVQLGSQHPAALAVNAAANSAVISGVWRANIDGLPAVTLNLNTESGALSGAVLFYLLRREPGKTETATAGVPEPLIDPRFDGVTLTFAVSHRQAHPPASMATPPVNFTLRITGEGKAQLTNVSESSPVVEMLRDRD
jgi:hypothetical protein